MLTLSFNGSIFGEKTGHVYQLKSQKLLGDRKSYNIHLEVSFLDWTMQNSKLFSFLSTVKNQDIPDFLCFEPIDWYFGIFCSNVILILI